MNRRRCEEGFGICGGRGRWKERGAEWEVSSGRAGCEEDCDGGREGWRDVESWRVMSIDRQEEIVLGMRPSKGNLSFNEVPKPYTTN